jgi:PPM family protein phosphatase
VTRKATTICGSEGELIVVIRAAGCSDRGPVRRTNEDAVFKDEELGLLIVADGMGGHAAGEVASRLAIDAVVGFIRRTSEDQEHSWPYGIDSSVSFNGNRLRTAVHLANRRVFREAENHDDYTGMGTTIVAALVNQATLTIAHVGDSRMYCAANGQLVQLTRDDSWAATVLGQRPLDGAAEQHPMRHVLTNVLGARDQTDIHVQERQIRPGELLLLCTDGLHGSVEDQMIHELLTTRGTVERTAEALVRAAIDRGSRDNVTALVAVCEE